MATTAMRKKALTVWQYLYAHRAQVHYPPSDRRVISIHDVATMPQLIGLVASGKCSIDCSQTVQLVCHVAGWRSPSGSYAYDGATASMLAGPCRQFSNPRDAFLMSIVVFLSVPGYGDAPGGHHTAFVIEPDHLHGNPLLGSHGQESDPRQIRLRDEWIAQRRRPYVFLSVTSL